MVVGTSGVLAEHPEPLLGGVLEYDGSTTPNREHHGRYISLSSVVHASCREETLYLNLFDSEAVFLKHLQDNLVNKAERNVLRNGE